MVSDEVTTEWTIGDLVIGETSGTTGVVEEGSTKEHLILSNVIGTFLEQEEIIQGNKVSKIRQKGDVIGVSPSLIRVKTQTLLTFLVRLLLRSPPLVLRLN